MSTELLAPAWWLKPLRWVWLLNMLLVGALACASCYHAFVNVFVDESHDTPFSLRITMASFVVTLCLLNYVIIRHSPRWEKKEIRLLAKGACILSGVGLAGYLLVVSIQYLIAGHI